MRRAATGMIGIPVALGACADAPDRASVTVRDSAGIEIVHSAAPAWGPGERWTVGFDPLVDIGVVEGDSAYQLDRVSDAAHLSDGRIVVANAGSAELRIFDPTGRHLKTVGGEGEGPGEFRVVANVWRMTGDSILAFDAGLTRLSVFDPEGGFVRTFRLEHREEVGLPSADGVFGDGSLLILSGTGSFGPDDLGLIEGSEWIVSRYGRDGGFGQVLLRLPGAPRWGLSAGGQVSFPYLPFTNGLPPRAAHGARLYAGAADRFEIEERTLTGELAGRIRWKGELRQIGDVEMARYREHRLEAAPSEAVRRRVERFLDEAPFPDRMPAYRKLLVDDRGHLWVEHYRAPWESVPRWSAFDPDGRWLGEVETPARVRVLRIGDDRLLGMTRDELDVEHVVVFGLSRGGP